MPRREWSPDDLIDEILRRKGATRAWAEATTRERPWRLLLTWTDAEEADYRRWWRQQVHRNLGLSGRQIDSAWVSFHLENGLHNRDECARFDQEGKGCEWCGRAPRELGSPGQDRAADGSSGG